MTHVPITSPEQAKEIGFNYRRHWRIESTFRFLQREGLRWEDFKVLDLISIRRLVNLALIAAIFLLDNHLFLDEAVAPNPDLVDGLVHRGWGFALGNICQSWNLAYGLFKVQRLCNSRAIVPSVGTFQDDVSAEPVKDSALRHYLLSSLVAGDGEL